MVSGEGMPDVTPNKQALVEDPWTFSDSNTENECLLGEQQLEGQEYGGI